MSDSEKIHDFAAPVSAIPCWTVYADYDGNAPDTDILVLCASEELAREVAALLHANIDKENHGRIFWRHEYWEGFSLPYVDGWQFARSWRVDKTTVPEADAEKRICRTVSAALEDVGGTPYTEEQTG